MSKPTKLSVKRINQDTASFNGLRAIKAYKPSRTDLSMDALEQSYQSMLSAQRTLIEKQVQFKAATDAQTAAEQEFHRKIVDMKDSVRGQFGANSDEMVAVGLKKRSTRKSPTRKKTA